ncbi:MAG TPA: EscU/YscU/HrcU family type III secretion system export apparatus switch protein [Ramlibacter sp.]|nr:EscU/YscU/HrcU family type III secretion system export apparatus switch protein [Ramlibacter sp.]
MEGQDLDRSEAATPHRLQKAHERGQTARSADLVSAAVFGVAMVYLAWHGWEMAGQVMRMSRAALLHAAAHAPASAGAAWWPLVTRLVTEAGAVVLPFMLALMAAAVLGTVLHTGVVFSFDPLKPDLQRINPATGLKRLLSGRTLFDALRACVKLAVLALAAWFALKSLLPQFHALAAMAPRALLRTAIDDVAGLGLKISLALGLIALVDVIYTRREFGRKLRMSRRELKDEIKHREGDPRIRARLRELRREARSRSLALRNTRSADVLLTNPTHYAVALRYVHGEMQAPQLVAKGAGQLAAAMREIAWRHQIAVVRNPALTRRMFRGIGLDEPVPPSFHAEVARIIVWVFAMREMRGRAAAGAPA